MHKKLVLFFTFSLGLGCLYAMEQEGVQSPSITQENYIPQAACQYPVYLINESEEDLDITVTSSPHIVTEKNAHVLKAILAGLTVPLPCHNLHDITDHDIVTKFKRAKFQFTIKPGDDLLLPGIATGQKITVWKKRLRTSVVPYELPIQGIETLAKGVPQDQKAIVKVYIKPVSSYGFDFHSCISYQDNHALNPAAKPSPSPIADGIAIPACQYPIKLFNKSEDTLDVTLVAHPSNTTTINGKYLQLVLVSLTASLNLDDMNGIITHNIQSKFKKAEFDFTIQPGNSLLLPGLAEGQQIITWKERAFLPTAVPYEIPLSSIEQKLYTIDPRKKAPEVVNIAITPGYVYGFYYDISIAQ